MTRVYPFLSIVALLIVAAMSPAFGQAPESDWYDPNASYVRIAVAEDGVYAVDRSALEQAGLPISADASTFRLYENGREIPIQVEGSDRVVFVGTRNRGDDELWAYDNTPSYQSSDERSLYSDTTYYWLTWGGAAGQRYAEASPASPSTTVSSVRDTLHAEQDQTYYLGRPFEAEHPLYRDAEGYYWRELRHSDTSPLSFSTTLDVGRRVPSASESLSLTMRLNSASASCHRVEIFADLLSGGSTTTESLGVVEWRGYARRDFSTTIPQDQIPASGLTLRAESTNDVFSDSSCPDPSRNPNYVLIDYVEATYTRSLASSDGSQVIPAPGTNATEFDLTNAGGSSVRVLHPMSGTRWSVPVSGGSASFVDSPPAPGSRYWVAATGSERAPAAVLPETTSNWASLSNGADYVILTTRGLEASARRLADFRRTFNGFDVDIVYVQDVYDEFDYGRPTPIAVRRFVQTTQEWTNGAPEFLTIWGDAQYPIYTGNEIDERRPFWNVSSFGYSPSDAWFAMQAGGPNDWSEIIAIGRVPIRSNAQGNLFVEKVETYERAPVDDWQQRMLLLAGGTSSFEQRQLQDYSNRWGELATRRTTELGDTLYAAGMDTLRYYKQVNDALDTSFRDSLALDLERGSGWINYFGHSAALTWEIVTDPPAEFNNAGRLPFVVSLGCRTGSFAGGRFEVKSLPSLGEQLVVGTIDEDGTPRGGGLNGGIAHWGTSALGNLRPSAILNDDLIDRVFVDTMRVLGTAIQSAKAAVAAEQGNSATMVRHLLQYGLIGDPATNLVIPDQTDLHITTDRIRISPSTPTPGETITIEALIANRGLVPDDSVDVTLTWERPDGEVEQRTRRIPRFAVQTTETFQVDADEAAVGTNLFRISLDGPNAYTESVETNNIAQREQIVFDTGVALVSPVDRGIASTEPTFRLGIVRQSPDPISVDIQIDTVATFDSPARLGTTLSATSVQLDWSPTTILADGQTYFWRARVSGDNSSNAWKQSRFTARSTITADWLQQDVLFQDNRQNQLRRANRAWTYDTYEVIVEQYSERGFGSSDFGFVLNDTEKLGKLTFGFGVLVLDDATGDVVAVESFPTYDVRDDLEPPFGDQQGAIDALRDFLDQYATSGRYVYVRTRHLARNSSSTIDPQVVDLFQNLGSSPASAPYTAAIDTLTYSDVWVMRTEVGKPGATVEDVSPASESDDVKEISLTQTLDFFFEEGSTVTPMIGPVTDWNELTWQIDAASSASEIAIEVLTPDSTRLLGPYTSLSGSAPLDAIDANTYPELRLRATLTDTLRREPPQLNIWTVDYAGVPELAVDASALRAISDSLQQGSTIDVQLPVFNLGSVPATDAKVTYTFTSGDNTTRVAARDTIASLDPGASVTRSVDVTSTDESGDVTLNATVRSSAPERITFNNTAIRNVQIFPDDTPPQLRVFSEGREIQARPDADDLNLKDARLPFVSLRPTLEIRIEDENPFFAIDDTSHVDVFLSEGLPSTDTGFLSTYEQIGFGTGPLSFEPSNPTEGIKEAVVTYTPDFTGRDSTYTLRVEATDGSNNEMEPYEVSFRVTADQTIRDVYPYPNPMSTNTTFAFRVEGGRTKDLRNFRLRIYTVSGRLIREFDERDLQTGALRVGWNLLPWNGRDEDGDRVATGVYLYRVSVDGSDGTFTGDVEKVAVIR